MLAAGTQGAGEMIGGDVGATVTNTGVQAVNASNQIQQGNVLGAVNSIGTGTGTAVGGNVG